MDGLTNALVSVIKNSGAAYCQHDEMRACESPIEADLIGAFKVQPCVEVLVGATKQQLIDKALSFEPRTVVIVAPQVVIGRYRADFIMAVHMGSRWVRLRAVECDGYKHHRATAEQRERDMRRDLYFNELGIQVERYTGRQIKKDPYRCAKNEIEAICPALTERSRSMMGSDQ